VELSILLYFRLCDVYINAGKSKNVCLGFKGKGKKVFLFSLPLSLNLLFPGWHF